MPTVRLTDRFLKSIKPPKAGRVEHWDTVAIGLGLRTSEAGRKSWVVMYRTKGRQRRMTLGTYPSLSLGDAREKAGDILRDATKGKDPATEKASERKAGTFNELADLYIEKYCKGVAYADWEAKGKNGQPPETNKKSWKLDELKINNDLRPAWGTRKANSITRRDVNQILNEIVERGAPIQANRTLGIIRKMFSWAISTDRIDLDVNPCHEVRKPARERIGDRVLDAEEIKTFWPMVGDDVMITEPSRIALRLILATAQRPGEVGGMAWAEIDSDWDTSAEPFWKIPGTRTKNGQMHRVPLSPLAVDLLKEVRELAGESDWAFPSPRGGKPILITSLSHALARSQHFGIKHFTAHDLRRTASTHMTGPHCKVSRFILERVLNHAEQSVTGKHYDLYQYDDEKRDALNAWAARLSQVIEGEKPESKVVLIRG